MKNKDLPDVQASDSKIKFGIKRVGVNNIPKIIRRKREGQYNELSSLIDVYVDLMPDQRGIHMSRNIEAINHVTSKLISEKILTSDSEELCANIAEKVLAVQPGATHSEVHLTAPYELETYSKAIEKNKTSVYKILAGANAEKKGKKIISSKIIGAEVQGTTVCPCSQELSRDYGEEKLSELGYEQGEIDKILNVLPLAAHNQRSTAVLTLETPLETKRIELEDIIRLLENAMSSPLHEVLKRKDEQAVVLYSHKHPAFVEDVVRTILKKVVDEFPHLPDETIVYVKQVNYESIHQHNALAEVRTTLSRLKDQLNGFEKE